jgi:outer membrane protein OmpA-like peptidoglycan-associated protein
MVASLLLLVSITAYAQKTRQTVLAAGSAAECMGAALDVISNGVSFDQDRATLTDRARQDIWLAAYNSTHNQYTPIDVAGDKDTSRYNQSLFECRAEAVAGELVRDGVPPSAITIRGFRKRDGLALTMQGFCASQKRRVEIVNGY